MVILDGAEIGVAKTCSNSSRSKMWVRSKEKILQRMQQDVGEQDAIERFNYAYRVLGDSNSNSIEGLFYEDFPDECIAMYDTELLSNMAFMANRTWAGKLKNDLLPIYLATGSIVLFRKRDSFLKKFKEF
jgi:hypothetical protein